MRKTKDLRIEFWRFVFSVYMVVYHVLGHVYDVKTGGYIAVDFFFILSGALLKRSEANSTCWEHMLKRWLRLYPVYLLAYIIDIASRVAQKGFSMGDALKLIGKSFPDLFMLRSEPYVINVSWYLTAMMAAEMAIYFVIRINRRLKIEIGGVSLVVWFIYDAFLRKMGRIHYTTGTDVFEIGYDGFWRALGGMGLGMSVCSLAKYFEKRRFKQHALYEIVGHTMIMAGMVCSFFCNFNYFDFWYIFLFAAAIFCFMISKYHEGHVWLYRLGSLAYPIYLLHPTIYRLFSAHIVEWHISLGCAIVVVVCILEASVVQRIEQFIRMYICKNRREAV